MNTINNTQPKTDLGFPQTSQKRVEELKDNAFNKILDGKISKDSDKGNSQTSENAKEPGNGLDKAEEKESALKKDDKEAKPTYRGEMLLELMSAMFNQTDISEEMAEFLLGSSEISEIAGVNLGVEGNSENVALENQAAVKALSQQGENAQNTQVFSLNAADKGEFSEVLVNLAQNTEAIPAELKLSLNTEEKANHAEELRAEIKVNSKADGAFQGISLEGLSYRNLQSAGKTGLNGEINPADEVKSAEIKGNEETSAKSAEVKGKNEAVINEKKPSEESKIVVKDEFSTNMIMSTAQRLNNLNQPEKPSLTFTADEAEAVGKANVMGQIIGNEKFDLQNGLNVFEMKLSPEFLGKISVKMAVENGRVTVDFIAENQKGELALRENIGQLQAALKAQGLEVDRISVSYDSFNNMDSQTNDSQTGEFVFQQDKNNNNNHNHQNGSHSKNFLRETEDEKISIIDESFFKLKQMSGLNYKI